MVPLATRACHHHVKGILLVVWVIGNPDHKKADCPHNKETRGLSWISKQGTNHRTLKLLCISHSS